MLTVIINWIYITITTYVIGFAILSLLSRKISIKPAFFNSIIAGVVFSSVYAQFFSLFHKVGLLANIILILITIGCIICYRNTIINPFRNFFNSTPKTIIIFGGIFFGICATYVFLLTLGVPTFIDTYLYHAQTIHWIEDYGCVKGIANLHDRLGFNSSFHAFTALYSMKWLFNQSLHATNGWNIVLLQSVALWNIYRGIKEKKIVVTALSITSFIYFLFTCGYSSSMGADIPAAVFVLILLILWCRTIEITPQNMDAFALLSVFAVYIVTVKFSCALFSLLFIYPAYLLIKEKNGKKIILYISLGLLVAVPFFIRTILITGWLVFPFSAIDLFSFDWEVPKFIVDAQSNLITMYARLPDDMAYANAHTALIDWFPRWVLAQNKNELIIFFLNIILIIAELIHLIIQLIKKQSLSPIWIITKSVAAICFLYWFLCAPAVRFGWSSMLFFPAVSLGHIFMTASVNQNRIRKYLSYVPYFALFIVLLLIGFRNNDRRVFDIQEALAQRPYVYQVDYPQIDTIGSFQLGDVTVYYPTEEGKSGYYAFPAAVTDYSEGGLSLRGNKIEDGFRF